MQWAWVFQLLLFHRWIVVDFVFNKSAILLDLRKRFPTSYRESSTTSSTALVLDAFLPIFCALADWTNHHEIALILIILLLFPTTTKLPPVVYPRLVRDSARIQFVESVPCSSKNIIVNGRIQSWGFRQSSTTVLEQYKQLKINQVWDRRKTLWFGIRITLFSWFLADRFLAESASACEDEEERKKLDLHCYTVWKVNE
jgi:hypothetical protein